jgi:hypothetical protein
MTSRAGRSPDAGRLEPWFHQPAVVSALIGALAMVLATIVTGLFGLVHVRSETEPAGPPAVDAVPALPAASADTPASPITFEAFLATMASEQLTELQRKVFLDEHLNRRVEWEGVVRDVTPAEGGDDKRYLLGLSPGTDAPRTAACWFAGSWGPDLVGLKPGQGVVVTGVLVSYDGTTPVLNSCSLKRV